MVTSASRFNKIEKLLTKVHSCQIPLQIYRLEMDQVATSGRKHTFAMYPQERRIRSPLFEDTALEEPISSSLVVSFAGDIVIN